MFLLQGPYTQVPAGMDHQEVPQVILVDRRIQGDILFSQALFQPFHAFPVRLLQRLQRPVQPAPVWIRAVCQQAVPGSSPAQRAAADAPAPEEYRADFPLVQPQELPQAVSPAAPGFQGIQERNEGSASEFFLDLFPCRRIPDAGEECVGINQPRLCPGNAAVPHAGERPKDKRQAPQDSLGYRFFPPQRVEGKQPLESCFRITGRYFHPAVCQRQQRFNSPVLLRKFLSQAPFQFFPRTLSFHHGRNPFIAFFFQSMHP